MNTINVKNYRSNYFGTSTREFNAQNTRRTPDSDNWVGQAATYEPGSFSRKVEQTKSAQNTRGDVKLSEGAQDILKQLQDKYGNMSFVVGSYRSDEEAQDILSRHTTDKEYSVLIDPETLEKMAADQAEKDKVIGTLDEALNSLTDIKNQLGDDAAKVKAFGISIGSDGKVSFFAEMQKASEKQQKIMEEKRTQRKEAAGAQEKQGEKKAEKKEKSYWVFASNAKELLQKIRAYEVNKKEGAGESAGQILDFTV